MNDILNNLQASFPLLINYKYLLLFVAASIEGFSTIMLAGFLLSVHSISLTPTFIALVGGEIMNGFLWYSVGYWGGGKAIDWVMRHRPKQQRIITRMREYMEQFTAHAILLAKMTFSVTVITEMLVGYVKYPPKKFAFYNIIGSIGWVVIVLFIGFFFGTSYTIIFGYIKNITHIVRFVAIALIILFVARLLFRNTFFKYVGFVEGVQKISEKVKNGFNKLMSKKG